jgi:enoyl-CoA hydratase/carnithine racemase
LVLRIVVVVCPMAEVYSSALVMASELARGPVHALAAAKAAIDGGLSVDLASGLRLESHLFASLFATDDRTIGMTAFLDGGRGTAVFTGAPG